MLLIEVIRIEFDIYHNLSCKHEKQEIETQPSTIHVYKKLLCNTGMP